MRRILLMSLVAVAGLVLAVGVTTAATKLTSQDVGLESEPLTAGEDLAPVTEATDARTTRTATGEARTTTPPRRTTSTPTQAPVPPPAEATPPTAAPVPEVGDSGGEDDGGKGRGRGRGRGRGGDDD